MTLDKARRETLTTSRRPGETGARRRKEVDDVSSALEVPHMAKKGSRPRHRLPAKPHDVAVDWSLVYEFISASVLNQDKARDMLKKTPALLQARYRLHETPLHYLAIENYLGGVRFLGQLGMDVNALNEFGDTALADVATLGNVPMAEELLRLGADVNAGSKSRTNALHAAMENNHWEIAKLLIKAGARTDYTSPYGETFLDVLPYDEVTRDGILELLRE
jgi:hypothetical protein